MVGSRCCGTPNSSQRRASHCCVIRPISSVREALVTSVTCEPPLLPPVRFYRSENIIHICGGTTLTGNGHITRYMQLLRVESTSSCRKCEEDEETKTSKGVIHFPQMRVLCNTYQSCFLSHILQFR